MIAELKCACGRLIKSREYDRCRGCDRKYMWLVEKLLVSGYSLQEATARADMSYPARTEPLFSL